jgi:hypothetical protein
MKGQWILLLWFSGLSLAPVRAQVASGGPRFDPGPYRVRDLWVDPLRGNDDRPGTTRENAVRTVRAAWSRIPPGQKLTGEGIRIRLMWGEYLEADTPEILESGWGTRESPIIIEAADGPGTAVLPPLRFRDCRHLYLLGLTVWGDYPGADLVRLEKCQYAFLRQMRLTGEGDHRNDEGPRRALLVSESQYVYVEDSEFTGGYEHALSLTAVQHGHVARSRIGRGGGWCLSAKGGSADLRVEANEIRDCGNGGFTAGLGSGLEFMVAPWVHYEAYDVQFVNNIVRDTEGAAFGVNGGYNILIAYNTAVQVGRRSHLVEVAFGERWCQENLARCQEWLDLGAWGTAAPEERIPIPNRNVTISNNVIWNPAGYQSQWQHFFIPGPTIDGLAADANLTIRGNWIWNGPRDLALGVDDAELTTDNQINTAPPEFVDAQAGDFRPAPVSNLWAARVFPLDPFPGGDQPSPPLAPLGDLRNLVVTDRMGIPRSLGPPGAYASGR